MIRLETKTRYYTIKYQEDLLGDIVIIYDFGSKNTHRAKRHTIFVDSIEKTKCTIEKIVKKRISRGYDIILNQLIFNE
jgi:hypothetical protein